jgi:aryl-alcohol dehydrogenase-like predicted oxidoreductase
MTFGTAGWGCDEKTALDLIARFLDAGGNFIDTADIYADGRSEEICGKALAGLAACEVAITAEVAASLEEATAPSPEYPGSMIARVQRGLDPREKH